MYKINEVSEKEYKEQWDKKRFPHVTISWKDPDNCTPIEDLRIWQRDLGYMCGIYGNIIEINKYCEDLIVNSKEFISYCPGGTSSDIKKLLWGYEGPHCYITRQLEFIEREIDDNKVIVKVSSSEDLPKWYGDIVATVF